MFCASETLGSLKPAPYHLRCENRQSPLGLDTPTPRFSWWLGSDKDADRQSAFEIEFETPDGARSSTGRVESSASNEVVCERLRICSRAGWRWRVRIWDEEGRVSDWSHNASLEYGLLEPSDWKAQWIGHPPRSTKRSAPPVYLRREFHLPARPRRARLYISARGLFEASINGIRVGTDYFVPGWTDYAKRNQYLTYDITDSLQSGNNACGIILADGWHNGYLKWNGERNFYGRDTALIAQLEVTLESGERVTIITDGSWKATTGPILESDLYNGEKYDARAELTGWDKPGFDSSEWFPPRIENAPTGPLEAKIIEPVRRQEILSAISKKRAPNGEWVFDFGQNVVGWARVRMQFRRSRTVTFRFAEMLNADGTLYLDNLRSAEAIDRYTFASEDPVEWEPRFTFHGFRYVGVSGFEDESSLESIDAVVLHTDASETWNFSSSNPTLNKLVSNIKWGQKGNYFEVPTDCPQRDERLGWTGDAQIFVRTASYNMEIRPFFEKWMRDMRDAQSTKGAFPFFAPNLGDGGVSPAWGDAGVICPWIVYERFGDIKILEENFEAMAAWVEFQKETSDALIWPGDKFGKGKGFGDWLAIDAPKPGEAPTPKLLIGTAYFAHCSSLLSKTATILRREKEARYFAKLAEEVRTAFQREFVEESGMLKKETQTGYLLALGFHLLKDSQIKAAKQGLLNELEAHDWHLSTGFIGTGLLMPVLSKIGCNDIAYRILLKESYPGWFYSIRQGATTMWERWNSYTHEDGFGPVDMNSFNHYAYGAIGEWIYSTIAGIDCLEPGYKRILIQPSPGGGLTWAEGKLECPYGPISTRWDLSSDHQFKLRVVIPPNTSAVVRLPNGHESEVESGEHHFDCHFSASPASD